MRAPHVPAIPISCFSPHRPLLLGSIIAVNLFRRSLLTVRSRDPNSSDHHHYEKNATRYWNNFYKRHQNKFFKDRHYLEKDWGQYFDDNGVPRDGKVALEVGCGAGNTIFPLVAAYPKLYVHACDFSPNAITLVKPNGYVLVRDYAIGDFSQMKLQERNQMIGENFYVRGDGTCSFYFSEDFLSNLFTKAGFSTKDINIYCKRIENRSRNITMDR